VSSSLSLQACSYLSSTSRGKTVWGREMFMARQPPWPYYPTLEYRQPVGGPDRMLWTAPPTWRVSRSSSCTHRQGCDTPGSSSSPPGCSACLCHLLVVSVVHSMCVLGAWHGENHLCLSVVEQLRDSAASLFSHILPLFSQLWIQFLKFRSQTFQTPLNKPCSIY
jgi:hypothetical protein